MSKECECKPTEGKFSCPIHPAILPPSAPTIDEQIEAVVAASAFLSIGMKDGRKNDLCRDLDAAAATMILVRDGKLVPAQKQPSGQFSGHPACGCTLTAPDYSALQRRLRNLNHTAEYEADRCGPKGYGSFRQYDLFKTVAELAAEAADAISALRAQVRPREPTPSMIEAARIRQFTVPGDIADLWRAMHDAGGPPAKEQS